MSKLGWGKKAITEGCITKWYRGFPIGKMVEYMRDNHRLLAEEHGGGVHRDSVLVYDQCKFMRDLNLPEPDLFKEPAEKYVELSTAVKTWYEYIKRNRIKVEFESIIELNEETTYFPNIEISKLKEKVEEKAKELGLQAKKDWEVATHSWVDVTEGVCYFRVYLDSENKMVFAYVRNYNKMPGLESNTQKAPPPIEYLQGVQQTLNL